jgi:hypothetical protein
MARPRFTLRFALWVTAAVALGITAWLAARQFRENQRLRIENSKLRNEVGRLTIEPGQEDRIHAIRIPSFEKSTWRWRVYVPDGKTLSVKVTVGQIPVDGFPRKNFQDQLPAGQHVLSVAIRSNGDKWELVTYQEQTGFGHSRFHQLTSEDVQWLDSTAGGTASHGVTQTTQAGATDQPFLLLRSRFIPDRFNKNPPALCDGIMIWLSK